MDNTNFTHSLEAKLWADTFIELFGYKKDTIDSDLMTLWFAKAILCGYNAGLERKRLNSRYYDYGAEMSLIRDGWGDVKYIETEKEVRELALEKMLDNKEPVYVYDYAAADFVPVTEVEII